MGIGLGKLKSLSFDKNPFSLGQVYGNDYKSVLLHTCIHLQALNEETIEKYERKTRSIIDAKSRIVEKYKQFQQTDINVEDNFQPNEGNVLSLKEIIYEMEKYQILIRQKQINIRNLQKKIETYIDNANNEKNQSAAQLTDEDKDREQSIFDKFLEKCNNMIESNPKLEGSLFNIVGNFSLIKDGLYSQQSLQFFKHHLFSNSNEKSELILDVITETILNKVLNIFKAEDIPSEIIYGLLEFAMEPLFKKLTQKLAERLIKIVIQNKDIKIINSKVEDNKKINIFSAALNYLSQVSNEDINNNNILKLMLEQGEFMHSLNVHLEEFFQNPWEDFLLKKSCIANDILSIICSLLTYSHHNKTIDEIKQYDHTLSVELLNIKEKFVEKNLETKLNSFQKNLSENSNENIDKDKKYFKTLLFGNLIRVYGALLSQIRDPSKITMLTKQGSVLSIILNILSHSNFFDPLIMSSICDCVNYTYTNPMIMDNKGDEFTTISNALHSLKTPLLFLSQGNQYKNACEIAASMGQPTMNNGVCLDFESLSSPVMHKMFISIINLITFYGKEAKSKKETPIKDICSKVSSDLNDFERQRIITNCLRLPSDEIKKAVMNCLFYIESNQFEKEEIKTIYSHINIGNITGGCSDIVISTIFIILAKAFDQYMNNAKGDGKEKLLYNKEAFNIAHLILLKNSERVSSNDEYETMKKEHLNLALIAFIINGSCYYHMKKFLCEKQNTEKIPMVLQNEEKQVNSKATLPIEIERSRGGWSMFTLKSCIDGTYSLYPYSYVFLRLMTHIADIMCNINYKSFSIDANDSFKEVMSNLKDEVLQREVNRIDNESKTFQDLLRNHKEKGTFNAEENSNTITQLSNERKDQQNNFIDMLPSFLSFIFGKTLTSQSIDHLWNDKRDPQFNMLNDNLSEQNTLASMIKSNDNDQSTKDNINIYESFSRILREEPIKTSKGNQDTNYGYSHIRLDLANYKKYGETQSSISRIRDEETLNNPHLRGLIICAFIRAMYGILAFPCEKEIKDKMIRMIRKGNTIKEISILVDSVKCQFNISSKYLMIMRYVLSDSTMQKKTNNFNDENELLNQINIISFMLKKMVRYKQNNINISNEDDKVFLSELSNCAIVITNETYSFSYANDIHREKTMTYIINYNLVKMFIDTVIQYMNYETNILMTEINKKSLLIGNETTMREDGDNPSSSISTTNNDTLIEMITKIPYILGEYMSKCKTLSYKILESFCRSYIFNGVNIRKTYLREIIETSKICDIKLQLEKKFSTDHHSYKIQFISRCIFTNYTEMTDYVRYILLTDNDIHLLQLKQGQSVLENNEWDIDTAEMSLDEFLRYKYDDIKKVFHFEFKNRMIIKTKISHFGIFFMKNNIARQFIDILRQKNQLSMSYAEILMISKRSNFNDDDDNEQRIFLLCLFEKEEGMLRFMDFFNRTSKDFIGKMRIIMIEKQRLVIYNEDSQMLKSRSIEKIFNFQQLNQQQQQEDVENNLASFYSKEDVYLLENITKVSFSETDLITLSFGSSTIKCKFFDDYSYLIFKRRIMKVMVSKGAQSNIFEKKKDLITQGSIYSIIP